MFIPKRVSSKKNYLVGQSSYHTLHKGRSIFLKAPFGTSKVINGRKDRLGFYIHFFSKQILHFLHLFQEPKY